MRLTKNFSSEEFDCKCGCDMPEDVLENIQELSENLQIIRDYIDEPISVNSGYRCLTHNRNIGSTDKSQHVLGKASDIVAKSYSSEEIYKIVQDLKLNPFLDKPLEINGVGLYDTFTHLDIRDKLAFWDKRAE